MSHASFTIKEESLSVDFYVYVSFRLDKCVGKSRCEDEKRFREASAFYRGENFDTGNYHSTVKILKHQ